MTTPKLHDLRADTTGERVGPGRYLVQLPDAWSYVNPSGGVLMTVALRTMQQELADPSLRPASATTIFCEPLLAGRVISDLTVLRRGSSAAQLRATLRMEGREPVGMETTATFVRDRPGIRVRDARFPDVPLPAQARPWDEPPPGATRRRYPIFDQIEQRLAIGNRWWEKGWAGGDARFARWFRPLVPQRDALGVDPLALPPFVDTMPPALRQKLGPDTPGFDAPSLDLTVHFLSPTQSDWLLVETRCRAAVGPYATADTELWGEDGELAAYGTQTMYLRPRRV